MNATAVAFFTKDRVALSRRTIGPLLQPDKFDLWHFDGSTTEEGTAFAGPRGGASVHTGVRGGPDAAVVYALTKMLAAEPEYTHLALVENDVLLPADWFVPTMELFAKGEQDRLNVGAVSARCYVDRILIQRPEYAVCHNLGFGMVVFTREAARIALNYHRTSVTTENRKIFNQLSGVDIGAYWAFRGNEHWLTGDWGTDRVLAEHGLASLALTPSPVEMIGQQPSLEEQGLALAKAPGLFPPGTPTFKLYQERLARVYDGRLRLTDDCPFHHSTANGWTIFPHQVRLFGGVYTGGWRLKWSQGFGPFSWVSDAADAELVVPLSGPCHFLVSGGAQGGRVELTDTHSGYNTVQDLAPEGTATQVLAVHMPAAVSYREIRLRALTPGVVFYGIQTVEQQPWQPAIVMFDHSHLPPV